MQNLSRLSGLAFIMLFVMSIFVACVDSDNSHAKDKGSQQDDGKKDDEALCKVNNTICNGAILSYCKVGQKKVVKDCKFYEMCDFLNQRCLEKCPNRRMKRCINNVIVDCPASGELKLRDCGKEGKKCVASHGNAKCVGKDGKKDDGKKDDGKKDDGKKDDGDGLCIKEQKWCTNGVLIVCKKGKKVVEKDCLIQEMCDLEHERCLEKCPKRGKLECRGGMIVECSESGVLKVKDCVAEDKGCVEVDGVPQCSDG